MTRPVFFDTNIYVYSDDASLPAKQEKAIHMIASAQRTGSLVISLQVMQEYFATVTRKLGVEAALAQRKVELMARARVVRFDENDVIAAIELHRLNRISFWDSMIVHAARLAGAEILYSEDLQAGAMLAGVRIVNPFADL